MAIEDLVLRRGREGNRWFNERPDGEEVVKWFAEAVKMPDGLDHGDYVGGVTLIPGKEKADEPRGFKDDGAPIFTEVQNLVFTPYVKVETRVQYWHDLMAAHPDWLGVIEPVAPLKPDPKLPPGYSRLVVATDKGNSSFVTATMKVTVYKRDTVVQKTRLNALTGEMQRWREGETIIDAPPATKQVPVLTRWGADADALMKAETGAVGRALGMAGMLIVPGTGVATAEDMRELAAQQGIQPAAVEERAPSSEGRASLDAGVEPTHNELVTTASGLINRLKAEDPIAHTQFMAWVNERGFTGKVAEMKDAVIKQLVKQAERFLDGSAGARPETPAAAEKAPQDG